MVEAVAWSSMPWGRKWLQSEVLLMLGGSATKFTQGSSNSPDKDLASSVVLVNSPDFCLYSHARANSTAPATLIATARGAWAGSMKYEVFFFCFLPFVFGNIHVGNLLNHVSFKLFMQAL